MLIAGCDVGSLSTEAVVMRNVEVLGFEIIRSGADPVRAASRAMDQLLARLGLSHGNIEYCMSTGYGRTLVPFADDNITEISCHGRAAAWLVPGLRTLIDAGGQDFKVIGLGANGTLEKFDINDKCGAGTGRSLELMAESLGVGVSELGPLSLEAVDPVILRNPCCVITEIEIRHLVLEGRDRADIAAAINEITAHRILNVVLSLGVKEEIGITGGVAKNIGVVRCLERGLGARFVEFPTDPQITGALGAALFAAERARA